MGYRTALDVLPDDLLAAVRQLAGGVSVYIPRRHEHSIDHDTINYKTRRV